MRNPLTKEAFAEWCEKQREGAEYDFYDCDNCACVQYFRDIGTGYRGTQEMMNLAHERPWTFSALATRLRS